MTDKLSQPEPLVNGSLPTLHYYPASEELTGAALKVLDYVEPLYNSLTLPPRQERERFALLAVSTITYFRRNRFCVCVSCLKRAADRSAFLYYCLRAAVLMVYGHPAGKIPHRSNLGE